MAEPDLLPVREFPDRGTQWLLDTPRNVREVVRLVAPELSGLMDFERLQRVRNTFLSNELSKQITDLLFRVPFRGADAEREVFVAILLEAQSGPDATMGFRLLRYEVRFWEQEEREHEAGEASGALRLTPCIGVVFYTGEESWPKLPGVTDLMDLPEALREFQPEPKALLLNLKARPPEDLTASGEPLGWVLRVLQKEGAEEEEIAAALAETTRQLDGLPDTEEDAWRRLMWFLLLLIYHRRPPEQREPLARIVIEAGQDHRRAREVSEMGMTIADDLMQRGEQRGMLQGMQRGMTQAKKDDVVRVLLARFPEAHPSWEERIRALDDLRRLDDLLVNVATADKLDDVVFH